MDDKTQLETRIRDLEDKLLRMEKRDSDRIDSAIRTVLPDEARAHMRNAFREQLLTVRSILDHWIDRSGEAPATTAPRERIRVD
ncbi:MAG TPA: hypothetical protein VIN34_09050 [Candidatus Limnocylindria bacterium]